MKRLKLITVAILVICPLVFTSCAGGRVGEVMPSPVPTPAPMPPPREIVPSVPEEGYTSIPAPTITLPTPEERMIVRTGDMSLIVKDVVKTRDEIAQLAVRLGGWVVSSNIYGEEEEIIGYISIRVPADKFDQTITELRGLAVRVISESTSSEDITEEYVDLQSRLRNAEATETEYLALLEKAVKVEDALKVYEALTQIRYEIEQIKGRMQYLERTTAMGLISVSLEPVATVKPLVSPAWSAREAAKSAIRGLTTFGQGLATAIIGAAIFSPIWGTILGVLLWRRRRKRK